MAQQEDNRLFTEETTDQVHERMLQRVTKPVDKREGSIVHDFTRYPSIEFEQLYIELDNVLAYGFARTSYGPFLEERAAEVGLYRKDAVKSRGNLIFTGPVGTFIPQGTKVTNENESVVVLTDIDATITNAGVPVIVPASTEFPGNAVGAQSDTLTKIDGELGMSAALVSVYNEDPFSDGHDIEDDDALKMRYKIRTDTIVAPGNEVYYRLLAVEVPGVYDARIYPRWRGRGTVRIVCLAPDKKAPAPSVIDAVTTNIHGSLLLGVDPTIEAAYEVPIDIEVNLTLKDYTLPSEALIEDARNHIEPLLVDYFANLAFNDLIVRYSRIGDRLLDAEPVLDYAGLRINGLTSNIALQSDQVAVLGRLTITIYN